MTVQSVEGTLLSRRQAEIVQLIVSGKSTREIAAALTLSPRTVETHVAAIYNKFGVNSRSELMLAVLGRDAKSSSSAMSPVFDALKTNLPVRRGVLIGRSTAIEDIASLSRTNKLVTVTGAGGIGKTQTALAVGEALLDEFAGGVWLVELAVLAHGSQVEEALARAVNVEPPKDDSLVEALVISLQSKSVLIVIDNCEHLIAQVAALADILMRRCSRLHILTTSREPLRIAGEQTYRLPSLLVPTREESAGLRAVKGLEYAAIELFCRRARAIDNTFALDDENTAIVAEICRQIDGIPLAIELAAARVNVLPLGALATKIDSHLRILAGRDRLSLPRHQTMHAVIDWSYYLLPPDEQRVFERMSVFAGSCELEEATAVCGDALHDEFATLDLLSSLVDKSLVAVDLHSTGPRYYLLQSFARYASEKLESSGETIATRGRHANAYMSLAERLDEQYELAPNQAWFSRVEIEFENFLSALDWTLEARHDIVVGQRLAAALRPAWIRARKQGDHWLTLARVLADERMAPLLAARLELAAAGAAYTFGDYKTAIATCNRLIAVFHELGDPLRAAYAQVFGAMSLLFLGRLAEAETLIGPALEVARSHGRDFLTAFALRAGAFLSFRRGDVEDGRAKLIEALVIYERIGAIRHTPTMLFLLADCEFQAGNVERALELSTRCLDLQRARGWNDRVSTLTNMSAYNIALNRWDLARACALEALELAYELRYANLLVWILQHVAAVLALSSDDGSRSESASAPAAEMPAASASPLGPRTRAALILGYVDAGILEAGHVREFNEQKEYERIRAAFRATDFADDLLQWLAKGATLTAQEAVALARST